MAFSIKYLRNRKPIWHAQWTVDIPPPRHFVRYCLDVHGADTAIVLDEDGHELVVERRLARDACVSVIEPGN